MAEYNKLLLAGEMLLNAAKEYRVSSTDIGYVRSILLAGAVINIVYPVIEELGIKPSQLESAELAVRLGEMRSEVSLEGRERSNQTSRFIRFSSYVYNSLKHSGNKVKKVEALNDLIFEANLKEEAYELIRHAIRDFRRIPFSQYSIHNHLSDELLELVNTPWNS